MFFYITGKTKNWFQDVAGCCRFSQRSSQTALPHSARPFAGQDVVHAHAYGRGRKIRHQGLQGWVRWQRSTEGARADDLSRDQGGPTEGSDDHHVYWTAVQREGWRHAAPCWWASWRGTTPLPSSSTRRWSERKLTLWTDSDSTSTSSWHPSLQSTGSQAISYPWMLPWWVKPHCGRADCIDFVEDDRGSDEAYFTHMEHWYLFTTSTPVLALFSNILGSIPNRAKDLVSNIVFFSLFKCNL